MSTAGEESGRPAPTRAAVLHPSLKSRGRVARSPESRLDEAVGLARAIDLEIVVHEVVPMSRLRSATYLGPGAVAELGMRVRDGDIALVCVDAALSPVQQRNLERAWGCKVIDRTGLILEIFGARARSREGRLQVELAHLTYQRSRLVRSWTHLERPRGGLGAVGGPGETQIESDRRQIDERIVRIKRALGKVVRTRELHRAARKRAPHPVIALVGYTNAGKSTLFNRLTRARVFADDLLFATLDPTMRGIDLPSGRTAILSDTVGFVSDLPTDLIAAFRATLEEVVEADIIVHVRDVSHLDSEAQADDVEAVLGNLGLNGDGSRPLFEALNKIDLLDEDERAVQLNRAQRRNDAVAISAVTGEGCAALLEMLDATLNTARRVVAIAVELTDGAAIAWLYRHGEVLKRSDDDRQAHMEVSLDASDLARFERRSASSA